jgi:hypothetical protein
VVVPPSRLSPPAVDIGNGSSSNTVVYLHSDHLGSTSAVTSESGTVLSQQEFDLWGKVRAGGVGQTKLNYTGQKPADTGLLYYHARYYDPVLPQSVSPATT